MFGISGPEFVVLAVVALLVLGPARMPAFARTLGHLLASARRSYQSVREQFEREIELDALKAEMRKSASAAKLVDEPAAVEPAELVDARAGDAARSGTTS